MINIYHLTNFAAKQRDMFNIFLMICVTDSPLCYIGYGGRSVFCILVFILLIASGAMLIKGAMGLSVPAVLGPGFTVLVMAQRLFGKRVAAIRAEEEEKKARLVAKL